MKAIIIHGYSSSASSIKESLGDTLLKTHKSRGGTPNGLELHYVDYLSLDDQVQLEDVAEALYLQLESKGHLKGAGRTLRFVVHSTGALVVRQMLKQYHWADLQSRVQSIVFVAPANFGSPLAHKGKSQLGRLKTILIDGLIEGGTYVSEWNFGEVGKQILTDLEMASPRQWDLSDYDLLTPGSGTLYHDGGIHAWVFTGSSDNSLTRFIMDTDGTDGVIVTSGAGLNVRRMHIAPTNVEWSKGGKRRLPVVPQMILTGTDHGSILTDMDVAGLVLDALAASDAVKRAALVESMEELEAVRNTHRGDRYQQFIMRVRDDRGNPVHDYDVSFNVWSRQALRELDIHPQMAARLFPPKFKSSKKADLRNPELSRTLDKMLRSKAHRHSASHEFRRFLMNIDETRRLLGTDDVLTFSLVATSGDDRIHYDTDQVNDVVIHPRISKTDPELFFPETTTQIDILLDRYSSSGSIVNIRS